MVFTEPVFQFQHSALIGTTEGDDHQGFSAPPLTDTYQKGPNLLDTI